MCRLSRKYDLVKEEKSSLEASYKRFYFNYLKY